MRHQSGYLRFASACKVPDRTHRLVPPTKVVGQEGFGTSPPLALLACHQPHQQLLYDGSLASFFFRFRLHSTNYTNLEAGRRRFPCSVGSEKAAPLSDASIIVVNRRELITRRNKQQPTVQPKNKTRLATDESDSSSDETCACSAEGQ